MRTGDGREHLDPMSLHNADTSLPELLFIAEAWSASQILEVRVCILEAKSAS